MTTETIEIEQGPTLGELVRAARARAGLTLRGLSVALLVAWEPGEARPEPVTLSTQFLHDVEHGRRELPVGWWRRVAKVLPGLTSLEMAQARARTGVVKLAAEELTDGQRAAVVEALVRAAEGGAAVRQENRPGDP